MGTIRIVADSTCDLSKELLKQYNITIIPLNIVLDMKSYQDGKDITPDEIYRWSDEVHMTRKLRHLSWDLYWRYYDL
jgi:fatty acid-binding protein DegV